MSSKPSSITAIIPAGGIGKRMQSQKPKQFLSLEDKPILLITLQALSETGLIDYFIIPTVDLVYTKKIIKNYIPDLNVSICKGGKNRQESIHNGLAELKKNNINSDYILIHDAVRALVKKQTIETVINKAQQTGAAVAARPVSDTIKQAYNQASEIIIKKNIPRDHLWQTQTPQVFASDILVQAYDKAKQDHFLGTDSAGLVERINHPVHLVESPPSNIKITTPEDLDLAKLYLASQ